MKYHNEVSVRSAGKILRETENTVAIDGAIRVLSEFKSRAYHDQILELAGHDNPIIKQSVAYYLGAVDANENADILIGLITDDDFDVISEAVTSFTSRLSLADHKKEKLVLPQLEAAFNRGEEMKVASLLSLLEIFGSESTKPLLLRIYREDDGILNNYGIKDKHGRLIRVIPIDLKTQVLDILKRVSIPEIQEDIIQQIGKVSLELSVKYIIAARNLKLSGLFDALTSLSDELYWQWSGFIVPALIDIDKNRSVKWAFTQLGQQLSLPKLT